MVRIGPYLNNHLELSTAASVLDPVPPIPAHSPLQSYYTMSATKKSPASKKKVVPSSHPPFADMIKVVLVVSYRSESHRTFLTCGPRVVSPFMLIYP